MLCLNQFYHYYVHTKVCVRILRSVRNYSRYIGLETVEWAHMYTHARIKNVSICFM